MKTHLLKYPHEVYLTEKPNLWISKQPFVHFTLTFIIGILTAYLLPNPLLTEAWILLLAFTTLYALFAYCTYRKKVIGSIQGLLGLTCIFLAGYIRNIDNAYKHHHKHIVDNTSSAQGYQAVVIATPIMRKNFVYTPLATQKVRFVHGWEPIFRKITLVLPAKTKISIKYGDIIMIKGSPNYTASTMPTDPKLPPQDLKQSLKHRPIKHFVKDSDILIMGYAPPYSLVAWALKSKTLLNQILAQHIIEKETFGFASALVLGTKENLPESLRNMYIGTGIIHLLAVSGLHIGLLYMLISWLLGLCYLRKKLLGTFIALSLLWFYASLTGFSPSVMRAVSLSSLFTIARLLKRNGHNVNTLASTAFLLLLHDPTLLFDISFQLSYSAVLGIIYLQPALYTCCRPRATWYKKIIQCATTSLAAQLATMPLSLYYFHTFPVYFLLANLLVTPLIPCIMTLTLLYFITNNLPIISTCILQANNTLIQSLNIIVQQIYHLPYAQIVDIYPTLSVTITMYGLMISLWQFINYRRILYLLIATGCATYILLSNISACT